MRRFGVVLVAVLVAAVMVALSACGPRAHHTAEPVYDDQGRQYRVNTYNDGELIECKSYRVSDGDLTCWETYNEDGRMLTSTSYYHGKVTGKYEYKYDKNGDLYRKTYYDSDGNVYETTDY